MKVRSGGWLGLGVSAAAMSFDRFCAEHVERPFLFEQCLANGEVRCKRMYGLWADLTSYELL